MKIKNSIRSLIAGSLIFTLVSSGLFAFSGCEKKSAVPELSAIPSSTATQPVPRDPKWVKRHEGFVETVKKTPDCQVLFIGDSITDFWCNKQRGAPEIWEKEFSKYKAVNLGISADRTQHLLWRLQNGELDGIKPKVIVMLIGTNNTGFERGSPAPRNTVAEAANGVTAVVSYLRKTLPESKILMHAIFPRGEPDSLQRKQVAEINLIIKNLHDGKWVNYLDINDKFLEEDGTIPTDIMPDLLHPNAKGYQIWADAIREPLAKMTK